MLKNKKQSAAHIPVICLGQISLQAFPRGVFSPTVMDKAVLAAAAPGGNAHQGSEASGRTESSGSVHLQREVWGRGEGNSDTTRHFPYLIVFLFFHGGKLDKKS